MRYNILTTNEAKIEKQGAVWGSDFNQIEYQ